MDPFMLIPICLFCAVIFVAWGASLYLRQWGARRKLLERIESNGSQTAAGGQEAAAAPASARTRFIKMTHFLGEHVKPKDEGGIARMQIKFIEAGIRSKNAIGFFFGTKVILAVLFAGLFLSLHIGLSRRITVTQVMLMAMVSAAIGFYLPNIWLRIKTDRRKEQIRLGFPDALDLLVVCAEAGMGLDAAIKRIGDEIRLSNKVLSDELNLLNLELRAGKSRRDALKNLGMRTGLEDVSSLATLLIQTDKFGSSVAQALRVQSDSMRVKRTQRVEELAAKLPVKLLFPTILFVFPSLFVVLLGPALISVYRIWTR